ncbi:COP9 signalosome complex subunit 4 [Vitis vinifera]|uniref:COP9 signalosome complex subunit 4 n=1 Tax=Vitis vinifera TaxID=29760 RepID=A0A438CVU2_VITVI|nr:COP9 signalosome complex subunit 4 [Vitis vinifera]RVW73738.1 COP9 signalosome complex subunit 4 [Vitis vinifera]
MLSGMDLDSTTRVIDDTLRLSKCVLIVRLYLEDDDAINAEAFINEASFLVSNSQHEVLNLQYKVCYARILDLKRKFLDAALRYYDISQVEKRQIGDELIDEEALEQALSAAVTTYKHIFTVVAVETNCSNGDIVIAQSRVGTLPSGISSFSMEITNACARGCSISNLHLKCSMFASAVLVNPKIFKHQDVDDCLVNGGSPLTAGFTISFKYANSFQYPLSLASATCD